MNSEYTFNSKAQKYTNIEAKKKNCSSPVRNIALGLKVEIP